MTHSHHLKDPRYWVPDPVLHKAGFDFLRAVDIPEIETPLGTMFVIALPDDSNPADWVCDLCSKQILTLLGVDQPFPVPIFGSYAFCLDHFNQASQPIDPRGLDHLIEEHVFSELEVRSMEIYDIAWHPEYEPREEYGYGPWPLHLCQCHFCMEQIIEWRKPLEFATGRRAFITKNTAHLS